jgi:peptidase A4-like protein
MIRMMTLGSALGALALLAGLTTIRGAGTHAVRLAAPAQPALLSGRGAAHLGRAMAPRIRLGNGYSSNWSGYDVTGSGFTGVAGQWIVPSAVKDPICSATTTYSSCWVGIDGDTSNTVEQCGTEQDYSNGQPSYYAWYEMYPKYPVILPNPVAPNDTIKASVQYTGGGSFTLSLTDVSKNWTFSTRQSAKKARLASAEWIMEAPSNVFGVLPLADFWTGGFNTVNFGNCAWSGPAAVPQSITMVDSSLNPKATPSASWGGGNFSVTYEKCQ